MEEDPAEADSNPYRYAGNDPTNETDSTGMYSSGICRSVIVSPNEVLKEAPGFDIGYTKGGGFQRRDMARYAGTGAYLGQISAFTGFDYGKLMGIGGTDSTTQFPRPPKTAEDVRNTGSKGIFIEYRGPLKVDFLQFYWLEARVDGKLQELPFSNRAVSSTNLKDPTYYTDKNPEGKSPYYIAGAFTGSIRSIGEKEWLSVMYDQPSTYAWVSEVAAAMEFLSKGNEGKPGAISILDGRSHRLQLIAHYTTYAVDTKTALSEKT
jgi:hypothetical protein